MAKKVVVEWVDDIDKNKHADETVKFSIDGATYEIDLSSKNAAKLRGEVENWSQHARRISGRRMQNATRSSVRTPAVVDTAQTQAIRDWAKQQGIKVAARGRVASNVIQAFQDAH